MAKIPDLFSQEDLYNVILLGGIRSPGKVTLSGHNRKVDWDVQAGPFLNGATTRFKAIPPIQFTASFYLVKDIPQGLDELADWAGFAQLLKSTVASPRAPKALAIYHPDLAEQDIKSVVLAEMGGRVYDGKGGATVVVKLQEYRAPRKWDGLPKPAKVVVTNADLKAEVARLTAVDQLPDAERQRLIDQGKLTPWGGIPGK